MESQSPFETRGGETDEVVCLVIGWCLNPLLKLGAVKLSALEGIMKKLLSQSPFETRGGETGIRGTWAGAYVSQSPFETRGGETTDFNTSL